MLHNPRLITRLAILLLAVLAIGLFAEVASAQTSQRIHIVQRGENLRMIAERYGTTWQAIATANNLRNPNLIYAGQSLIIPVAQVPQQRSYTVQRGDTLSGIAVRFNTTWQAIAQLNNIANPRRIYAGQVLVLPAVGGPIVTPPGPIVGGRYTVQRGDTMASISRRFNVNMWDIARANSILNLNRIFAGQSLVIPGR